MKRVLEMMSYIQLPPDQSLDTKLSPKVWEGLKALTAGTLPEPMLKRSRPWFVSVALVQMVLPAVANPMDISLMNKAKEQGNGLMFLETWEFQVSMMNELPDEFSLMSIVEAVEQPAQFKGQLQTLMDCYRGGDVAAAIGIVLQDDSFAQFDDVKEALFFKRNRSWLPPIEALIKEGDGFVAVGLGHLIGEGSVIALLKEKGYSVERVSY